MTDQVTNSDTLSAADTVAGATGNDTVSAADTLTAADTLAATDTLAGAGNDTLKGDDTVKGADGKDKPTGAPEAYEPFKMPEGVEVDAEALADFSVTAKELNLTQEQAQKVADIGAKLVSKAAAQQAQVWADTQDKWVKDGKADKEFGGDAYEANVAVAKKALEAFGTKELKDALVATGGGNHPELIRFFFRVGKAIGEDRLVVGSAAGGKRDPAQIMFGDTSK